MRNKAVFLDRDGVICRDVNYCSRPEDLKLLPTVPQAIKLLNDHNYLTIVITNQSGIARGYFTHKILSDIHNKMIDEFARFNARIDDIRYCPHHPDEGCNCRKPGTALFEQAIQKHAINTKASFMIGDEQKDIDAGRAMGCRTVLVTNSVTHKKECLLRADYTALNLLDAVNWILTLKFHLYF
ncbi:MAG TPA: HAD family hydrolase [Dehalococcoidia bacterium]|nr:HAD family hydrolase [Dehalococcoidia bacterium]